MTSDILLSADDQDTLFQIKAWRDSWEAVWGSSFPTRKGQSTHFYRSNIKLKQFLPVISDYPRGTHSPECGSVRSEYYKPPCGKGDYEAYLKDAYSNASHQIVFPDVIAGSNFYSTVSALARSEGWFFLERNPSVAYSVNTTTGDYQSYLQNLGSNTRLKLHNRRKRLFESGAVEFVKGTDPEKFLESLNVFHEKRWQKRCFDAETLDFIRIYLDKLLAEGHAYELNEMHLEGEIISVLLDIKVNGRIYNLQSGYEESLIKGVSLGTLHLGFQIEAAFQDPSVNAYDFMAGFGKNTNYKAKLSNQEINLVDITIVKPWWLKTLYRLNSRE